MMEAGAGRCQEASTLSHGTYIPCNAPAKFIVGWPTRNEGPYRMCAMCADHNVRNRGGTIVGPYIADSGESSDAQVGCTPAMLTDIMAAVAVSATKDRMSTPQTSVASLIEERQRLRAWMDGEEKRLSDFLAPHRKRLAELDGQCQAMMLEQGVKSVKTDFGTGILTTTDSAKIKPEERTEYLDWCLENWDTIGSEMLQIGAPKAEAVRNWMQEHDGALPPHTEITSITRFSVRKI